MAIETTMKRAERDLGRLCDMAVAGETIIIRRDDGEDVALVSASELSQMMETMHLIRSPKNAVRLFTALGRIRDRETPPS
jgi:antitoxin YefM